MILIQVKLGLNLRAFITAQIMTCLIFKVFVEGKLVLLLPIRYFVPLEPVNCGLQVTRFQVPHVTNV